MAETMTSPSTTQPAMTTDAQLDVLRDCCAVLDKLPGERTRTIALRYLWDRYVAHPIGFRELAGNNVSKEEDLDRD
jgi:hypothetical protein